MNRLSRVVRKTFISLRNRNFRLYFSGQLISNTGNWLTNVALVLLVLKLTRSGLAVGVLAACQFGPILLLSAYGGALADRSGHMRRGARRTAREGACAPRRHHPDRPFIRMRYTEGGCIRG